jgi:hypothetical protein
MYVDFLQSPTEPAWHQIHAPQAGASLTPGRTCGFMLSIATQGGETSK